MKTMTVLRLDTEALDWRSAFTGLVGWLLAATLIGVLGNVGVAAGVAVHLVVGADDTTHKGPDLAQLLLVAGGALVTYIVGVSTSAAAAAAVVIGLVTLACTLVLLLGSRGALVGGRLRRRRRHRPERPVRPRIGRERRRGDTADR